MFLLLMACSITPEEFSDQLFEMQCQLNQCTKPDDGCSSSYIQPRVDCDFQSAKAKKCLRAVEKIFKQNSDLFEVWDDGYRTCLCRDTEAADYFEDSVDYQSEECTSIPDANELPSECDSVCSDI